jgi:hypothetical protein
MYTVICIVLLFKDLFSSFISNLLQDTIKYSIHQVLLYMGNGSSTTRVVPFHHQDDSQVHAKNLSGDFYWACRNGDLQLVEKIYPELTYEQLNQIQPNGSTALHAACSLNHPHIVKFLLDNGCCRTRLDSQKRRAYEVAATEEIRILFDRPWSQRFVQEQGAELFNFCSSDDTTEKKLKKPNDWVSGHTWKSFTYEAQFMLALGKSSSCFKNIVKKRLESNHHEALLNLLNKSIGQNDPMYPEATNLFEEFLSKADVDPLLKLYTLQTGFYGALQKEADALTAIIYLNLTELQNRAFQGQAYRGAAMTDNDLDAYRWALKKKESYHEYLLQTRTLQSMSLKRNVALGFAKTNPNDPRYSVLFVFDFPELCPTAINLNKISEQLPCLSAYGQEAEVLLLPFTLFKVKDIKADPERHEYRILLIHEPTPIKSLRRAAARLKCFSFC